MTRLDRRRRRAGRGEGAPKTGPCGQTDVLCRAPQQRCRCTIRHQRLVRWVRVPDSPRRHARGAPSRFNRAATQPNARALTHHSEAKITPPRRHEDCSIVPRVVGRPRRLAAPRPGTSFQRVGMTAQECLSVAPAQQSCRKRVVRTMIDKKLIAYITAAAMPPSRTAQTSLNPTSAPHMNAFPPFNPSVRERPTLCVRAQIHFPPSDPPVVMPVLQSEGRPLHARAGRVRERTASAVPPPAHPIVGLPAKHSNSN